jgi:hypothetical protein
MFLRLCHQRIASKLQYWHNILLSLTIYSFMVSSYILYSHLSSLHELSTLLPLMVSPNLLNVISVSRLRSRVMRWEYIVSKWRSHHSIDRTHSLREHRLLHVFTRFDKWIVILMSWLLSSSASIHENVLEVNVIFVLWVIEQVSWILHYWHFLLRSNCSIFSYSLHSIFTGILLCEVLYYFQTSLVTGHVVKSEVMGSLHRNLVNISLNWWWKSILVLDCSVALVDWIRIKVVMKYFYALFVIACSSL